MAAEPGADGETYMAKQQKRDQQPGKKQYFPGKNSRGMPTRTKPNDEPTTPRGKRRGKK